MIDGSPEHQLAERSQKINAPDTTQKICLECNRQFTGIVSACPHDGTLLVKIQQDPIIGSVLDGSYEVLSLIGHGGMGVVYKARHKLMDRVVAIKMLKSTLVSDSMSVKRFQQEVKATGRLVHPHAITVYDFGISPDGLPYIVMDYLEGASLSEVIKKEDHIAVERGVRILSQACEALTHAHKQGVVHRDLKPSNIVLINFDGDPDYVKVVDFGVAKLVGGASEGAQKLTQTGEVCGSPVYMSPEQCLGQELDLRSDIYSMGIVIYETLTGKLPLLGRTMVDTMSKHVSEMPQPFKTIRPDIYIPERLEQVVFKAMAKDANKRHQSMEELREDLENAVPKPGRSTSLRNTQTVAAYPQAYPDKGGSSKKMMIMVAVIAMSVTAAGIALFAMIQSGSTKVGPRAGELMQNDDATSDESSTTHDTDKRANPETTSKSNGTTSAPPEKSPSGEGTAPTASNTVHAGHAARVPEATEHRNNFAPKHTTVAQLKEPNAVAPHKAHAHPVKPKHAGSEDVDENKSKKLFDGLREQLNSKGKL